MNSSRKEEYFVGIDMGTGSLGVAVTDQQYHLLKIKGKDFWFVREYETAQTQLKRRSNRISRRRLRRHQTRVGLIRSYFAEEVLSHDSLFYIRQDNSKYYFEDKDSRLKTKDVFFADRDYGDKEFYKEYPTIFHLRCALLQDNISNEERYSRLLYLAIINMFEHRGHFLLNSDTSDVNNDMIKEFEEIVFDYIQGLMEEELPEISYTDLINILADKSISRLGKKDKIIALLSIKKSDKSVIEIIKCLCGLEADARVMFKIETEDKIKIAFQQTTYEDAKEEIEEAIGETYYTILDSIKKIYDYCQLKSILKDSDYLSESRVKMYEKHKRDLKLLKDVYKRYLSPEMYDNMFRSDRKGTYSAYCNSLNSNNSLAKAKKYRRNMKGRTRDELYATIKKDLKNIEGPDVEMILKEIDFEQFLPKQLTGANGAIPNQVHKKELKKILENAEKHLSFLGDKDENGYTVSERIVMLFSSNIPYYVGPVGNGSKTGWAIIRETGRVLPWNVEQKIDIEKTSEEFIRRLIKECTYLSGEKVLPKQSLLYEKYCVLNEINNLQINGKRIVPELKQDIYNEIFIGSQLGKKVTKKTLCSYLINRGIIFDESEVSGIDREINAYLSSYGKMYPIFGERLKEQRVNDIAEEIIYYGTIYGDSKSMFRKCLSKYVAERVITEANVKRILGYKFKDWARLSKNMICLSGCDKNTGEIISIIRAMWDYNLNFMELIHSDNFSFKEELESKRNILEKPIKDFRFEDLEEYYYSAPVKRMIWQTVLALREVTHIMGHSPKRVFIEMTRTDEEKGERGRKASREKKLLKLYECIKGERNWAVEIKNVNKSGRINSKKLYLYYLQKGRDAYTGEEIDIDELFEDNRYDIDHIYPRSLTNDNNIENNLVLASKYINQNVKKNDYPLPVMVRNNSKVRDLWYTLHKLGFMNDEKYKRLTSNEHLTEEQLSGFIARQLVETSQGTKGIAELLKVMLPEPDTKIVYTKAKNVSDFRKEYDLLKSRLTNEHHHAKDAYLNIVVGNVYFTKFTQNPINFLKTESKKSNENYGYNLYKMYESDVVRNGEVAWKAQRENEPGTIKLVKETMCKNTPIITKQVFEQKGELFDVQPVGKYSAKSDNYVPLKAADRKLRDVEKYGGYTSLNPAYFIFIEHGPEKKRKRCFEVVRSYDTSQIRNEEELTEFLGKEGYINPRVICGKIKKNSLIKLNGYFLYIVGMDSRKNVEFSNATAMCLKNKYIKYISRLEKMNAERSESSINLERYEDITSEKNLQLYRELTEKHMNSIYKNHPRGIGTYLKNGEQAFTLLDLREQVKLLCDVLQYTSFKKGTFSLKVIGGPNEVGRIRISGNMTGANELKIINYSITGMYKEEVDLLI